MSCNHDSVEDETMKLMVQCNVGHEVLSSITKSEFDHPEQNEQRYQDEKLRISPKADCTTNFLGNNLDTEEMEKYKLNTDEQTSTFENNNFEQDIMPQNGSKKKTTSTLPNPNSSQHLIDNDLDMLRIMAKVHTNNLEQMPQNGKMVKTATTSPDPNSSQNLINDSDVQRIMAQIHERYNPRQKRNLHPEKVLCCTYINDNFRYADDNANNQTVAQNSLGSDDISTYEEYQLAQVNRASYFHGVKSFKDTDTRYKSQQSRQFDEMDSDIMWISPNEAIVRAQVHKENEDK